MSDTNIIEKEPAYRKREEEAAKRGKKIPSYMTVYSSTIMYLTLGMYLIAVQILNGLLLHFIHIYLTNVKRFYQVHV